MDDNGIYPILDDLCKVSMDIDFDVDFDVEFDMDFDVDFDVDLWWFMIIKLLIT